MRVSSNESGTPSTRRRALWWILPLLVLIVLVAIIYFLSHLSAADSEMYPTTMLHHMQRAILQLC